MKLILHAGCHKTATSWFQSFCHHYAAELMERGVCYPALDGQTQHSTLAWDIQRGKFDGFSAVLREAARQLGNDGVILLSGEEFENCLVDVWFAQKVEALAREAGCDDIEWVFVSRKPLEYLESIYAQLSKNRIVVHYGAAAESVVNAGYFSTLTRHYNYHFVFDVEAFSDRLSGYIDGCQTVLTFGEFKAGFPGRVILARFFKPDHLDSLFARYPRKSPSNTRSSRFDVELNYAQNCCGLRLKDSRPLRKLLAVLAVYPLAYVRLKWVNGWRDVTRDMPGMS